MQIYDPVSGTYVDSTTDVTYSGSDGTDSTIDSGSSSGVAGIDLGGLVTDIGTAVGKAYQSINGQPVQRLPNGQVLLPSGQVVSQTPVFSSGSSSLLLLVGFGLVLILILRQK